MTRRFMFFLLCILALNLSVGRCFDEKVRQKSDGDWVDVIIQRQDNKKIILTLEIAITPQAQAKGLMHRTSLNHGNGMLFLYSNPVYARFWMKNTLIALDMIFIDEKGRVVFIHKNAQPHDLTPVTSPVPVLAVLEIPASNVDDYGISVGDRVLMDGTVKRRRWSLLSSGDRETNP